MGNIKEGYYWVEKMKDTILVVDDKEVNRYMICEIFKKNYKFLEAEDGLEAVELLKTNSDSIAIVLLDIIMPNLDGFGVLDFMKNNKSLDDIPVVMITSDSSIETEKKLEAYDVAEVVRKPFIPAIINRRVNNIIALYDSKRKSDEKKQKIIDELNLKICGLEERHKLDIDESIYLVKTLYSIMKKNNILDKELEEDIQEYLARYIKL